MLSKLVYLTADGTAVNPENFTMLLVSSDNTTAANRTFTLNASTVGVGHELMLLFTSGSSTTAELANSGIQKLSAAWTPTQYDSLHLVFDGTNWVEVARKNVLSAGSVVLADLDSGIAPSHVVKYAGRHTTVGGSATEAITVSGVAATDNVKIEIRTVGATPRTIVSATTSTNTVTVVFSGDPSTDHVIYYEVTRAAA